MLAKVHSAAIVGLDAVLVEVEVDIASQGLPSFTIVGLPDKAVEEAKERVRSAIRNSGADFPPKRITVNLAPADLPKEGPSYDLPIALGILIASGQLQADIKDSLFVGELALDGRLRSVNGVLSYTLLAKDKRIHKLYVPSENSYEAAIIHDVAVFSLDSLSFLYYHLNGQKPLDPTPTTSLTTLIDQLLFEYDMQDIYGQEQAKRALEIAAAGAHNVLLKGPPGAGKTLLARTLPSILPNLSFDEMLEVTQIYSAAGLLQDNIITTRPFRSPHHTTSLVGIIGGSSNPKPGEITLAHRGVLFLDEFPEFPRSVLESLRQPIEDGLVSIARANSKVTFPAKMMLVAAQNPCPCGYYGDKLHTCKCSPSQILRYRKKVSGPILDRIDIHLDVPAVKVEKLTRSEKAVENSTAIRKRVQKARERQAVRYHKASFKTNAELSSKAIKEFCQLTPEALLLLHTAVEKLALSARTYHRIIKLAQTIADLAEADIIQKEHIAESLQFRPKTVDTL